MKPPIISEILITAKKAHKDYWRKKKREMYSFRLPDKDRLYSSIEFASKYQQGDFWLWDGETPKVSLKADDMVIVRRTR